MRNLKKEKYLKILFLLSISILLAAYAIQYLLGYQPCNLCLIERIPYALAIIIIILNYIYKKDQIFFSVLLMMIFFFSFTISFYHLGIEQGFISESTVCNNNTNLITKKDILKSLQNFNISCKNVAFKIFGLSLTTYNALTSILMLLLSIKIYNFGNGIKK